MLAFTRHVHANCADLGGFVKHLNRGILLGLLSCAGLIAQSVSTSQISGTVQDSTGLAIEGAAVRVTQTDTGLVRDVTSAAEDRKSVV